MPRRLALAAALLAATPAAPAFAQQEARAVAQHRTRYSIGIAPLELVKPVLEMRFEYRLGGRLGATAVLGAGQVSIDDADGESKSFTTTQLGALINWYPIGDFDKGVVVSGELKYVNVDAENLGGALAGLAIGPLVGYKIATTIGFTFVGQFGLSYLVVDAADGERELSESVGCDLCYLNVALVLGWSF